MMSRHHDAMTPPHDVMTPTTEPDDATVEQVEAPAPLGAIPVDVEGPVQTRELPAKAAGYRRVTLDAITPQRVLGRDPRRRRAVIQVYDATGTTHGVMFGTSRNEVTPPAAFAARLGVTLPAGGVPVASQPLELFGMDEVWAVADTAGCELTVIAEQWAD